ncbi:hypothetical protein NCC78_08835 [Micromonospora phytophila]|nr:hypothetical protein [Micromonospora phytophila]MCM0674793.1 hypothetical protein [Micromonospora phytophila]
MALVTEGDVGAGAGVRSCRCADEGASRSDPPTQESTRIGIPVPAIEPHGVSVPVIDPGGQIANPLGRSPILRRLEQRRTDPLVPRLIRYHRVDLRRGLRPQYLINSLVDDETGERFVAEHPDPALP